MTHRVAHSIMTAILSACLLAAGCSNWMPDIAQSAHSPVIADHSVQAVRALTAALAAFEENHITGGDFIHNDPWLVAVAGILLVLSPYVCGKALWLLMGQAVRLLTTPRAARTLGESR